MDKIELKNKNDIIDCIKAMFNCRKIYPQKFVCRPYCEHYVIEFPNYIKVAIDITPYFLGISRIPDFEIKQEIQKGITEAYMKGTILQKQWFEI